MEDKIPVIDMENLYKIPFDKDDPKIQKIAQLLGDALREYGFAYLSNHGIPQEMVDNAFHESKTFFELPANTKMKYAKNLEGQVKNYHGYAKLGQELLNETSMSEIREGFDVMQRSRFYPTQEAPGFQSAVESLENSCREFNLKLLKILAMSLHLSDLDFFCKAASNLTDQNAVSVSALRSNYYPSIGNDQIVGATRCAAHTDWDIVTLLFQDDLGGLEIQRSDNKWLQAPPIPNTIVMNVGDLLEIWTGGYFPGIVHRVLVPEAEVKRKMARQSIGYFLFTDDHVIIEPLTKEIPLTLPHPEKYTPTTSPAYFLKKASQAYGL